MTKAHRVVSHKLQLDGCKAKPKDTAYVKWYGGERGNGGEIRTEQN